MKTGIEKVNDHWEIQHICICGVSVEVLEELNIDALSKDDMDRSELLNSEQAEFC